MSYEELVKLFDKLNKNIPEDNLKMSLTETISVWEGIYGLNKNKKIPADLDIDLDNLIHFYIVEYASFAVCVDDKSNMRETLLYSGLFTTITNTVFTIWKLAIDGLDYSAKVLLRNLLELMLILITVLLDSEKRNAIMDATENDTTKEVWHKHFRSDKMIAVISKYLKAVENPLKKWVKEQYTHFSSYVHNDFWALLGFSRAVTDKEKEITHLNICGNYATRTNHLLDEVAELCYVFDLMFVFIYREKIKDKTDTTFSGFLTEEESWKKAMCLSEINKICYEEIISKKNNKK